LDRTRASDHCCRRSRTCNPRGCSSLSPRWRPPQTITHRCQSAPATTSPPPTETSREGSNAFFADECGDHWQVQCGRRAAAARVQHLMQKMELQPAIDRLSQSSSRVSSSVAYMNHLQARLDTMGTMKRLVKAKAPSRWKFECYKKEQLAAHQLSKDLLYGCTGPSIVVWGNGGFGPTSRGHASAPNKRLRRLLSKYLPVILSSEYRSSQRSACCHSHLMDRPSPKRVTVKQCTTCKTLLSRDVSAACIILDIFEFQRLALARAQAHQTRDLPAFIH
jgi:hypothetical protein